MAYSPPFPNVWAWIQNLPPITQWKNDTISMCICSSPSYQPSLKLSITKTLHSSMHLTILIDYHIPIVLWTSKPTQLTSSKPTTQSISHLLNNFVQDVLNYGPTRSPSRVALRLPRLDDSDTIGDIFNVSFLTLAFIICIYECPQELRASCIHTLKDHFSCPRSRAASTLLMRLMGSNMEEQWMRCVNLAITNWIVELQAAASNAVGHTITTPSPLFSYSNSSFGLWKVQLYCPVIAMEVESSSGPSPDEHLRFSLNYHQLEGVIQLNHKVTIRENWIEVMVNIDNIRCDVMRLLDESLMNGRGVGKSEKHFPSRISLKLTPTLQANIISVSVHKSSENPTTEIGMEKTVEASFEPPNLSLGLRVAGGETVVMSLKPWKFEQSVKGDSTYLNWFLHDSVDGREVFSSKPSKLALVHPKAWFKNRYSSAHRPFTKHGGVIFAGDEYGEKVVWKVDKSTMGRTMEWELKGWVWLTYWPNKHRTFYTETRMAKFTQLLHLTLV
nr:uncharacterized protein LOC109177370 [Ipomoea trifida]